MKKQLKLGVIGLVSILSCNLTNATELKLNLWNEDIGPVKGGNFLRDQEFLANGGISGKNPGSGLFVIPDSRNNESPAYALFELFPRVTGITKTGEMISSLSLEKMDELWKKNELRGHSLKLPGEKIEMTLPVNPEDLLSLHVFLKAYPFSFTTNGGSVWISNNSKPASLTPIISWVKGEEALPKDVVFSWTKVEPQKAASDAHIDIRFAHSTGSLPVFDKSKLVSDWKMNLGLYCDKSQIVTESKGWCYMTRGLNRAYRGADDAKDLLGLGDDFTFYAGHPVSASPYQKD